MLSYSGKSSYHSIRFFECVLEILLIEFSTYHIKCEDNVMILIQTLWRCARTLITTTTLSLLFHYSLSLLLCSAGPSETGGRRGQTPPPPPEFVRYVKGPSINYVVSKLVISDPLSPSVVFLLRKIGDF